ncbi:MAG: glycoside hydrolase family 55 protein [Cyanobacteria bacterium J06600_6]
MRFHLGKIGVLFLLGLLLAVFNLIPVMRVERGMLSANASIEVQYPAQGDQINVKDFGAVGDGITDDTEAIKQAINATSHELQIIYLPEGTYVVSDTLELGRFLTLQGVSSVKTTIKLKENSPGFATQVKPVLRTFFNNNQTFAAYIQGITVKIGTGNPQAIGIRYNTHNYGAIDDVAIISEDLAGAVGLDLSETEFGPGMVSNLTVIGFDTGIKTPANVSHAVLENITLEKQRVVGLQNQMPLSVHNLTSINQVPAVTNAANPISHLVLIDAQLEGLSGTTGAAIQTEGSYYLRNIKTAGDYQSALQVRGESIPEKNIRERWSDSLAISAPSDRGHLKLAIESPPSQPIDPVSNWVVPDSSQADSTEALQMAMNSGAKTIFLPGDITYKISRTIEIPETVERIIAQKRPHGNIQVSESAKNTRKFVSRPMFKFVGDTSKPVSVEWLKLSAWPHQPVVFEVATNRPVTFKYCDGADRGSIKTAASWSGKVYIDEWLGTLDLHGQGSVWVRQWNPENNPFNPAKSSSQVTYGVNDGVKLWVLGIKTEAPAIHLVTENQGQTEILGGFFRDHLNPQEYKPEVPYFVTDNGSISASYVQYAWAQGKARSLQALEIRESDRREVTSQPETMIVDLYRS